METFPRLDDSLIDDSGQPPILAAGQAKPKIAPARRRSLLNGEHPDDSALRHVRVPTDQIGHQGLLERRVDAVTGLHCDILHAIDFEG